MFTFNKNKKSTAGFTLLTFVIIVSSVFAFLTYYSLEQDALLSYQIDTSIKKHETYFNSISEKELQKLRTI
jgi:hypothetical protein